MSNPNAQDMKAILRAQALAAAGLPQFPPEVVEEMEKRRQRKLVNRWSRLKMRIAAAWEQLRKPSRAERLENAPAAADPSAAGLPSDTVTFQLLKQSIATMARLHEDTVRLSEYQRRQFEQVCAALKLIAEAADVEIGTAIEAEPPKLDEKARLAIEELNRIFRLDA